MPSVFTVEGTSCPWRIKLGRKVIGCFSSRHEAAKEAAKRNFPRDESCTPSTCWRVVFSRPPGVPMSGTKPPPRLVEVAKKCRRIIKRAEDAGLEIDDTNVVDLCADNLPRTSLADIRSALVVAGMAQRFPKSTSRAAYHSRGDLGAPRAWHADMAHQKAYGSDYFIHAGRRALQRKQCKRAIGDLLAAASLVAAAFTHWQAAGDAGGHPMFAKRDRAVADLKKAVVRACRRR